MGRLFVEIMEEAPTFVNAVQQRELSLRSLHLSAIENLGVTKDQFDVIDLTDNNLRKIDNFPVLKRLESLLLHNNRVQQIQKDIGEKLPNLKTLALTNNFISALGDLLPLSACQKLEYLTLVGNPVTHKSHYRSYVIFKLPKVRVLDFCRVKDSERTAAKKLFGSEDGKKLEEQLSKMPRDANPTRAFLDVDGSMDVTLEEKSEVQLPRNSMEISVGADEGKKPEEQLPQESMEVSLGIEEGKKPEEPLEIPQDSTKAALEHEEGNKPEEQLEITQDSMEIS